MPKIIFSILVITVFSCLVFSSNAIFAYFNDFEYSISRGFLVNTLDFSLFSPHNNFVPVSKASHMEPGDRVGRMIQVRQQGDLPFEYTIQTVQTGGDNDFCQALELEANNNTSGLMDFFTADAMGANNNNRTWQFKVLLPENIGNELTGKFCRFKFVFNAQQNGGPGFSDQEEIESILTSASQFPETPAPVPPSNVTRITTSLERSH